MTREEAVERLRMKCVEVKARMEETKGDELTEETPEEIRKWCETASDVLWTAIDVVINGPDSDQHINECMKALDDETLEFIAVTCEFMRDQTTLAQETALRAMSKQGNSKVSMMLAMNRLEKIASQ